MSYLLAKHKESLLAAEKLINEHQLYAASVHCSYYSCIQLIKYLFLNLVPGINLALFEDDLKKKGSHNYLRIQMKRKLVDVGASTKEANDFDDALKLMKTFRENADYNEYKVDGTISKTVFQVSGQVNSLLKKNFHMS